MHLSKEKEEEGQIHKLVLAKPLAIHSFNNEKVQKPN